MISSIFKELILYGKTCVKYILPRYFVDKIPRQYFVKSYSQEGEDMILRRLFERKDKGVYIDVGAHHPKKFSNTYYFYKKGWSGINLDAMPGSMLRFDKVRPRDLNIETAISDTKETLKYFIPEFK